MSERKKCEAKRAEGWNIEGRLEEGDERGDETKEEQREQLRERKEGIKKKNMERWG